MKVCNVSLNNNRFIDRQWCELYYLIIMKKSTNNRKKIYVLIMFVFGLVFFGFTGYLLQENLNPKPTDAAYQSCVKYGQSATLKSFSYTSSGVAVNVTATTKGNFTFKPATPNLRWYKSGGYFRASTNTNKVVFTANYGHNSVKNCLNFFVK